MKQSTCPKCEKIAVDTRKYTNGDVLYVHRLVEKKKPFPHYDIVDSCYVAAKVAE